MQSCCGCWQLFARIFGNSFNGSGTYKSTPLNASEQNFLFSFPSLNITKSWRLWRNCGFSWWLCASPAKSTSAAAPQQITTTIFTILVLLHIYFHFPFLTLGKLLLIAYEDLDLRDQWVLFKSKEGLSGGNQSSQLSKTSKKRISFSFSSVPPLKAKWTDSVTGICPPRPKNNYRSLQAH